MRKLMIRDRGLLHGTGVLNGFCWSRVVWDNRDKSSNNNRLREDIRFMAWCVGRNA